MVIGSVLLMMTMLSIVLMKKHKMDTTNRNLVHGTMQEGEGMEQTYPDFFIGTQLQRLY
jgi:hypothetical protein